MIVLDPKLVAAAIKDAATQTDAVIAVYRMVYPNWDDIDTIGDAIIPWPQCNKTTAVNICRLFIDRGQQGNTMPGGLWMNKGFSQDTDHNLPDWHVLPAPVTLKKSPHPDADLGVDSTNQSAYKETK